MQNRKVIILAIITLAVILAAGITSRLRAPQSTISTQVLFPELTGRINDIAGITIKGNRNTVVLQQHGDLWVLANADNYPALFNKIKQNVVGVTELRIVDQKTDNPEFHARLGVEGPEVEDTKSLLLTLQDRSGQTVCDLIVGNKRQSSSSKPGLYVRKPDSAQALLVEGFLDISDKPSDWFDNRLFDIPDTRVQEVRISYPRTGEQAQEDLVIHKDTQEQPDFAVNLPSLGTDPSTTIVASRISRGLEEMRAEHVLSLQNFTFPEDATITTTVSTFDGLVVTARLVQKEQAHYANFSFAHNPSAAAGNTGTDDANQSAAGEMAAPATDPMSPAAAAGLLNKNLSPWVYQIPDFLFEALTTRPEQFRKLNLLPEEEE
ncbi:MAG: DUF4340 domain-containing protein [Gammaproteobacteria bacterium]